MIKLWQRRKHQSFQRSQSRSRLGFTLIELLVAIILAGLVLTPLLAFMVNILQTEQREQAKASTEQEIQTALDYITQDIQQSIYIYDGPGLTAVSGQLPSYTGAAPVLAFWKRSFIPRDRQVKDVDNKTTTAGCLVKLDSGTCDESDYYVYSLVTYYLVKDTNPNWSNAARITRVEIQDGIRATGQGKYLTDPDKGFQLFNSDIPKIENRMNSWTKKSGEAYTASMTTLIDYVDQTGTGRPNPVDCQAKNTAMNLVPASATTAGNPTGFYACVRTNADNERPLAEIYIRGNAIARLPNSTNINYSANQSTLFPSASIQVQGRGLLGLDLNF